MRLQLHAIVQPCPLILLSAMLTVSLYSETWFVYPGTGSSGSGTSWRQAKRSIQEAVAVSQPNDMILIGYSDTDITLYPVTASIQITHPLKIKSARFMEDTLFMAAVPDSSRCILDGLNQARIFTVTFEADSARSLTAAAEFTGLTLINGNASNETVLPAHGGAVCVTGYGRLSLFNCLIENALASNNALPGFGGGLCCSGESSLMILQHCSINRNRASAVSQGSGGGLAVTGGAKASLVSVRIEGNQGTASPFEYGSGGGLYCSGNSTGLQMISGRIRGNIASASPSGSGGGIFSGGGSDILIQRCLIDSNRVTLHDFPYGSAGGGLYCTGDSSLVTVQYTQILDNAGGNAGGGVSLTHGVSAGIEHSEITRNSASQTPDQTGFGGGIFCSGAGTAPVLMMNTIRRNNASLSYSGFGGGIYLADSVVFVLNQCTVDSNTASRDAIFQPGFGGGVCASGDSTRISLLGSVFQQNTASMRGPGYGGGITLLDGADGIISGSQILINTGTLASLQQGEGGGIFLRGQGTNPVISGNVIIGNQAAVDSRGIGGGICISDTAAPEIRSNTMTGNTASLNMGGFGGGIACGYTGAPVIISMNQLNNNIASFNASGFGGAIYLNSGANAICQQNTFLLNVASVSELDLGQGGGLCLENETETPLHINCTGNRFEKNTANMTGHGRGGVLAVSGNGAQHLSFIHNLCIGNSASSGLYYGQGGALYYSGQGSATVIRNNHFINNHEDYTENTLGEGAVFYLEATFPDTAIRNNLFFADDNLADEAFVLYSLLPCTVTHNAFYGYANLISSEITSNAQITADPMLDPVSLIPKIGSPLIDAGYDTVLTMNDRYSGWAVDIGNYEFNGLKILKSATQTDLDLSFGGQVRGKVQFISVDAGIDVSIEVMLQTRHLMAYHILPRWYRIICSSEEKQHGGSIILSYTDGESAGFDEHTLRLWHFNSQENLWDGPFAAVRDTIANWIQAPFTRLSGDWVITDARDMNAVPSMNFTIQSTRLPEAVSIEWNIQHPDISGTAVWRSEQGNPFALLSGSRTIIEPGTALRSFCYLDTMVVEGTIYKYQIEAVYPDGKSVFSEAIEIQFNPVPEKSTLLPNFPNPFNAGTEIAFLLASAEPVSLEIMNLSGAIIRKWGPAPFTAGEHRIHWDGKDHWGRPVSSGFYICRLRTSAFSRSQRMLMLR